jgi:hypothetical protein
LVRLLTAALFAVVTLRAVGPARADVGVPAQTSGRALPPPPAGTHRLIRIGPQALVREDEHGRVELVDEASAPPPLGRALTATVVLGLFGLGLAGGIWAGEQQDVVRGRVR